MLFTNDELTGLMSTGLCDEASAPCPWCSNTCKFIRAEQAVKGVVHPEVVTYVKLGPRNYRCPFCEGYFDTNEPEDIHWRPVDQSKKAIRWRLRYKGKCAELVTSAARADWANLSLSKLREQVKWELSRMLLEHDEEATPDVNRT